MLNFLLASGWVSLLALVSSYAVTRITIPVVIRVAREKHLMDEPNGRSSHIQKTPTLGGIAIFAALAIVFVLVSHLIPAQHSQAHLILPSLVILFFVGLKDDILIIDPHKKLAAQILSGSLLILFTDIRISSLFGLFDIYQLPYVISFLLTLFVIIAVVNAYNLIDGIDGLAGGLGIAACITFGIYFYIAGLLWATILCTTLIGALISFIQFNFSRTHKVFMGDCGSLTVGFILALLAIKFIQINEIPHIAYIKNAPTLAIAVLALPLFDTLRVFMHRIANRKSPFHPDRNHVHHFIIDKGFTHFQATVILCSTNTILVAISFLAFAQVSVALSFLALIFIFTTYSLLARRKAITTTRETNIYVSQPLRRKLQRESTNQL